MLPGVLASHSQKRSRDICHTIPPPAGRSVPAAPLTRSDPLGQDTRVIPPRALCSRVVRMRRLIVSLAALLGLVALFPSNALVQQVQAPRYIEQRGGFDVSGPYEVDPNWPKKTWPAPGYIWGSQSGVYPESADRVFLSSRGEIELPKDARIGPDFPGNWGALNRGGATGQVPVFRNNILINDRQGNLVESWTQWD